MSYSKYRAQPTTVDGTRFASKKEAKRYWTLKMLEKAGEITGLELQPKFPFKYKGKLMFTYRGDFQYKTKEGQTIIEDVKGFKTPVYNLKKKIIETEYGFTINEV